MSSIPRWPLELRYNTDGTPDELVCTEAYVHLEQMSDMHWWMVIRDEKTGREVHVNLTSRRKITARFDEYEGTSK